MTAQSNSRFSFRAKFATAKNATLVGVTLVAFTLLVANARAWRGRKVAASPQELAVAQPTPVSVVNEYVIRTHLWPQLREPLNALGDRLERPGKERVTFLGTITRGQGNGARPFKLIQEFPGRLRTEEQNGNQIVVLGVDIAKGGPWKSGGTLTADEDDEIESLVLDSTEGFYFSLLDTSPMRPLGSRFRLDDGKTKNYTGPFYDLYEFRLPEGIGKKNRQYRRVYCVNSDTMLMERVRTEISSPGNTHAFEIRFRGWRRVGDQAVPSVIEQLKDDRTRLTINLTSVTFSPKANDGIFNRPQ